MPHYFCEFPEENNFEYAPLEGRGLSEALAKMLCPEKSMRGLNANEPANSERRQQIKVQEEILGLLGSNKISYHRVPDVLKTTASKKVVEKGFAEYKRKTYLLARAS